MDQKIRYSPKSENQLCFLFGHTYRLKRGLKHIKLKPPIHDGHFNKIIRSLDPRVPILWPSEIFRSKKQTQGQLQTWSIFQYIESIITHKHHEVTMHIRSIYYPQLFEYCSVENTFLTTNKTNKTFESKRNGHWMHFKMFNIEQTL